jgi:hypothetical protein
LGYLTGVDVMIKAGLWAILKFKDINSLQELTMHDSKDLRKTCIYQLAREGHLRDFKKIILLSSFEDTYVTWHSARIVPHEPSTHSEAGRVEQEMV